PRVDVRDGPQPTEHGGGVHQDVDPAMAAVELGAQRIEAVGLRQVDRHQRRRRAAGGADRIVELLQRALRAAERDHLGAGRRQRQRRRPSDAARGPGDECNAAGKRPGCRGIVRHAGLLADWGPRSTRISDAPQALSLTTKGTKVAKVTNEAEALFVSFMSFVVRKNACAAAWPASRYFGRAA